MTTTPKDQMPINGPYYTPEQRNKIGKKLDKAINERIDMDIPKDQATKTIWYEANTGNHQGLIINETNGDNIAVTYKKEDAALIAKAVNCHDELVESLKEAEEFLNIICKVICPNNPPPHGNEILGRMRKALSKAEGKESETN